MVQPASRSRPGAVRRPAISSRRLWPLVFLSAICLAAPARAAGASPAPTAAPSRLPAETTTQVWFDGPLPDDIAVGGSITIGFTLWDHVRRSYSDLPEAEVRVHPVAGDAAPALATARSDWPGHLTATITVPKGGPGEIEVGVLDPGCQGTSGACSPPFMAMTIGGIGPPSGARASALLLAAIHLPGRPYSASVPINLDVVVERRANWAPETVPFPQHLVALASNGQGESVGTADLRPIPGRDGHYAGAIAIGQPGDATLVVAARPDRGADDVLESSLTRLTVEGATGATPGVAVPILGGDVPILPLLAIAALLTVVTVALKRGLADL